MDLDKNSSQDLEDKLKELFAENNEEFKEAEEQSEESPVSENQMSSPLKKDSFLNSNSSANSATLPVTLAGIHLEFTKDEKECVLNDILENTLNIETLAQNEISELLAQVLQRNAEH